MRQIVSLIKDNQVHYAVVNLDDGSLIPFADVLLPDPERFGLHDAALLGTNLIEALGLNGAKRPKPAQISLAHLPAARVDQAPTQPELPAPKPARTRHANTRVKRFISLDQVVEMIDRHPEGLSARDIAAHIAGTYPQPAERWVVRTVENRLNLHDMNVKEGKKPARFRTERVMKGNQPRRIVYPLNQGGV